jgi:site-specific DNA-methyltransferase (adenine-specific)
MTWEIICGDCVPVMASMPAASVKLITPDPPYNIGIDYGAHHNDSMPAAEYLDWSHSWLAGARRLLTDDGSLWLLVNWELAYKLVPIAESVGLHLHQTIVWYETFGVNCTRKFNRCSRPLLWFVADPRRFVFNADSPHVRRPSDRQTKYNDKRANPNGKLLDDVWVISRVCGTFHERIPGFPTQLPLAFLRPIVGVASNQGDQVLDPFSGSATSGAVCVELYRRYIGIEKSPDFAARSRTRLENVTPMVPGLLA